MLEYPFGIDLGLARGNEELFAAFGELFQHFLNAAIQPVLKEPRYAEAFAVIFRCLLRFLIRKPEKGFEGICERRPDEFFELRSVRDLDAEFRKRIFDAARDAGCGICQRAVKIEQDIIKHIFLPSVQYSVLIAQGLRSDRLKAFEIIGHYLLYCACGG